MDVEYAGITAAELAAGTAILALEATSQDIKTVTDALPVLTETGGTLTASAAEQNVYVNNAPAGVYEPICVDIDFTNQTATETTIIREYKRIRTGGALILNDVPVTYAGVVADPKVRTVTLLPNRFGVAVTLECSVSGTFRDYDWSTSYKE